MVAFYSISFLKLTTIKDLETMNICIRNIWYFHRLWSGFNTGPRGWRGTEKDGQLQKHVPLLFGYFLKDEEDTWKKYKPYCSLDAPENSFDLLKQDVGEIDSRWLREVPELTEQHNTEINRATECHICHKPGFGIKRNKNSGRMIMSLGIYWSWTRV